MKALLQGEKYLDSARSLVLPRSVRDNLQSKLCLIVLAVAPILGCGLGGDDDTGQDPTKTTKSSAEESNSETGVGATTMVVDPTNASATDTDDVTTQTPTTGSSDPTFGTTGTFIVTPDGGNVGTIECDVFKQDCDVGEKCTAWAEGGGGAWNATKCVMVTGTKAPGDTCMTEGGGVSGMDDCEAGAMCWDVDAMNMGVCIALCEGTEMAPTCSVPMTKCVIVNDGVLNLCLPTCDPLQQDCAGDDLCIPNPDGTDFTCVLDASGDLGKANDACEFANACDKGLMCLDTAGAGTKCMQGSTGCCQPFCEFDMANTKICDSDAGQECVMFFDPMTVPPGFEKVGVCAIPA